MMVRLNQPICMLLLLTFGFHADCVFSVSLDIEAFTDEKRLVAFFKVDNSSIAECLLHTDGGKSLPINKEHVTLLTTGVLENYLNKCTKIRLWPIAYKRVRKSLTFPGTKWCGIGNTADSYPDLGSKREVDICCRKHDHCKIHIPRFKVKYGLHNLSMFTVSHCSCDREFKKCLQQQQDNKIANIIYNMYFNFLQLKCIEEKIIQVCVKTRFSTCQKYELQSKMEFSSP